MSEQTQTPIKKAQSLRKVYDQQFDKEYDEKQDLRFRSEKGLVLASTLACSKIKRKIDFTQTKSSQVGNPIANQPIRRQHTNPQKKQDGISTAQFQTSVSEVVDTTNKIVQKLYHNDQQFNIQKLQKKNRQKILEFNKSFRQRIIKILKQIKQKPKDLSSHLNIIYYSAPSVKIMGLSLIQKQILKQWRNNPLLTSIRSEWYLCIQEYLPFFGEQAQEIFSLVIYQSYCTLMAKLTYFLFKPYFQLEQNKNNKTKDFLITKLRNQTVRYLVTQSSSWQSTVYLTLFGIMNQKQIKNSQLNKNVKDQLIASIMKQLKSKSFYDLLITKRVNEQNFFSQTKQALSRFTKQRYIVSKIKGILNIRVCLEQDILSYQKQLIERNQLNEFQMLQKDDILTCIMLSILSSSLCLKTLYMNLREVRTILGNETEKILAIYKCPSYFTDLQAAVEFLQHQCNLLRDKGDQLLF